MTNVERAAPSGAQDCETVGRRGQRRNAGNRGLRHHKKVQTHHSLQAAARRLVSERGLDHVTVDEIAATAGVSKRTFFNYFDSKEGCVVDAPPGTWQRLAAALDVRPADEPLLESLRAASRVVITEMAPGLQQLAGLVHVNPALMQRHLASFAEFQTVIVDWAARRARLDPITEYQPELFAAIAGTALQVAVNRCGEGPDPQMADVVNGVFDFFARGATLAP